MMATENQPNNTDASESYDLTPRMSPYFDVHMVSPLLDHLSEMELYTPKVLTKEKIKIIEPTNMINLAEDEYLKYPDDPEMQAEYKATEPIFREREERAFDLLDNEPESVKMVSTFFENTDVISDLKANSNLTLEYLIEHFGISADAIESYINHSKFKYECGYYGDAEAMLGNYLSITQTNSSLVLGALWGRLACRIVQAKWGDALADLIAVKDAIEVRNIAPLDQLRQRGWLMHWSLFVYLNRGSEGVDALVDLFSDKAYLQTLENLCPWLLRYYSAAVILSPSKRHTKLRDLLNEISSMSYLYNDPITLFLGSLFDQFDFDEAQTRLKECQELVRTDFFLQIHANNFVHEARMLICEMYCAINRKVDLTMLADKLQLTDEEAERWMVDMVRGNTSSQGATLDARIDSSGKQAIISPPPRSAHKQIVEASRDLTTRSGILSNNLETLVKEQAGYIKMKVGYHL